MRPSLNKIIILLVLTLSHPSFAFSQLNEVRENELNSRIEKLQEELWLLHANANDRELEPNFLLDSKTKPMLSLAVGDSEWGESGSGIVRLVCREAISPIWVAAKKPKVPTIAIVNSKIGPSLPPRRRENDIFVVHLNWRDEGLYKLVYQFSHEFVHVLATLHGRPNGRSKNGWFEESLCDCGSFFAYRALAQSWADAESEFKRQYSSTFSDAADNWALRAAKTDSLGAWFRENRERLKRNATNYKFNLPATIALHQYFETNPNAWATVEYLNNGPCGNSFESHLQLWHGRVPPELKPHVSSIARLFEIEIKTE